MPRLPIDYSKSIIYKIYCKDPNIKEEYVGSTTNFTKRKNEHKRYCYNKQQQHYNYKLYQFIRDNGGWSNWGMVMIEEYKECENKLQLLKKEREYIEQLGTSLNNNIPSRTQQEWYKDNKDRLIKKSNENYFLNKEEIIKKRKEKYILNKEEIINKSKIYYDKVKEKLKIKVKCDICNKEMRKDCLKRHIKTIHNKKINM